MAVVDDLPLLVVLLGPTASGKTALSLALAEKFNGEIVSCDSVAVYRELEIGTAKPSAAERALVPHHCIDIVSPEHDYSAGDYERDGRAAIAAIAARGRLPIVTGGTGLYLRALLEGLFDGPQRSELLRARLRRSGLRHKSDWLSRVLRRLDPSAAERIHANDTPKLIRAIEVSLEARRPITEAWTAGAQPLTGYRILRIGLVPERAALYHRIDARAAAMFERGLVAETEALIAKYGGERRVFDALGYRQARQFLSGELTEAQAIEAAQRGHRNYAKRQLTWFRREQEVRWLAGFGDDPAIQQAATDAVATCRA
ncbi:MAG TPA: tRNA (adenosine(37)-N6)-dimethylallyltransferase MiaA [Acidobacteriaceae bacterium]|nr:tRNA (adenosine(37)-N6)-dimethylallyltransferase MiaA [Acidobacteriaceae bacterium]